MTGNLHQLRYSLRTLDPVVLSSLAGSAVLQETEGFIPGSAIWGAMAYAFIAHRRLNFDNAHTDPDFRRLFLRGGLRFLNAYPASPEDHDVRLLPAPLSIYQRKGDDKSAADRTLQDAGGEEGLVRITGFCMIYGGTLHRYQSESRLEYHTSRVDRSKGRATKGQGPFVYEALVPEQQFCGLILGSKDDLESILKLESELVLGRSRSAQYGRVELNVKAEPQPFRSEIPGIDEDGEDAHGSEEGLVLTLTSHLLPLPSPDEKAKLAPEFPFEQLGQVVGVDPGELRNNCRCFARDLVVGGYSGVWKMPRRQAPALNAGSVFVFPSVKKVPTDLESVSLGQRTGEGFGRFVVNWHLGGVQIISLLNRTQAPRPIGEPPRAVQELVADVTRRRLDDFAIRRGMQEASNLQGVPSNSLLSRLHKLFSENPLDRAMAKLRELEGSEKQIGRALRAFRRSGSTFHDVIDEFLRIDLSLEPDWRPLDDVSRQVGMAGARVDDKAARVFALTLLQELAKRRRRVPRRSSHGS